MNVSLMLAFSISVAWLYLLLGRGNFWRAMERDDLSSETPPAVWPEVIALVPARNEAELIDETIAALASQDYPGAFSIIMIDDNSRDGTAGIAVAAASKAGAGDRLSVLNGSQPPLGWTGKLWAVQQGVAAALRRSPAPRYLWLCDADIRFAPDTLRSLVRRAEANGLVLASLMAKLRCISLAERCLVPAFVFFFQMFYPFAWIGRRDRRTAAAAGGCMLVRRSALAEIGGIAAIRNALIDDCALGRRLKQKGPVWLGLSDRAQSLRRYEHFHDIRQMVARTAYAQLGYSPLLLAGTVAGFGLVFLGPPMLALFAQHTARWLSALDWAAMSAAFLPILRFYRLPPAWAVALPLIAAAYLAFTLDSAYQHARGRGGLWKERAQALPASGK